MPMDQIDSESDPSVNGIGLSIVRRIAEIHDGELLYKHTGRSKTTFTIRWAGGQSRLTADFQIVRIIVELTIVIVFVIFGIILYPDNVAGLRVDENFADSRLSGDLHLDLINKSAALFF